MDALSKSPLKKFLFSVRGVTTVVVGVIYRPPSAPVTAAIEDLQTQLAHAICTGKPVFVLGDTNFDTLKPDKADVHRYLQMISAMDMKQLVSCPTRPASGSLIDHVLVRQSDDITTTRVEPCSWSDHDLVIAETTLQRERRRPAEVTIRSTRDLVPDALCLELLVSDWSAVYSATDPADKWKAWLAVWSPVIDRHMPEKKIRPRHSPAPWITENDELQTMMRERDLADAERRAQPADEQAAQRYRLCRNRVKSAQISAKSDFFLTSYRRSRRTTWKDIRRFLISPRAGASSASSSPSGPRWADRLNEYFASVGPSVAAALEEAQRVTEPLPPRPPRVVSGAFRVHPVTLSELSAAVKRWSDRQYIPMGVQMIRERPLPLH
ncbi:hypothetical protein FJT64_009479 [Amphibalanus amphitrite]|uniref:Endonuclease/exonuclease/phosphatase domain-containing protein n=1 Tax=Amphibalanus amphitrite TaxID=1232801 RepID=A0A6A4VQY6_AMPAM|nr:hypothetical protein FJT64_009479 [Amphibalanus amphitrite]